MFSLFYVLCKITSSFIGWWNASYEIDIKIKLKQRINEVELNFPLVIKILLCNHT